MEALHSTVMKLIRERWEAAHRSPFLLAIDGRCASGKTTLAASLARELGCPVIHMDDFFLRPEQRTPERLAAPGENIDHERFLAEVLIPLREGRALAYRPFSCRTQALGEPVTLSPAPLVIIEGSYAHHPALRDAYDLRILLDITPEEQGRRILRRNGEEMAALFREKWIPMEEAYFQYAAVSDHAHAVFTNQ